MIGQSSTRIAPCAPLPRPLTSHRTPFQTPRPHLHSSPPHPFPTANTPHITRAAMNPHELQPSTRNRNRRRRAGVATTSTLETDESSTRNPALTHPSHPGSQHEGLLPTPSLEHPLAPSLAPGSSPVGHNDSQPSPPSQDSLPASQDPLPPPTSSPKGGWLSQFVVLVTDYLNAIFPIRDLINSLPRSGTWDRVWRMIFLLLFVISLNVVISIVKTW